MDKHILGKVFYENEVSSYGQEHGYVDYLTLKKAFNAVLNNSIMAVGEWDLVNGTEVDDEGSYQEVFQTYIIDSNGAEILRFWTDELVYYSEELDMYVWGVTHYGTAWDYVLTDIRCEKKS